MKRPAFQFYPADWRKDAALQSCSLAARGLWIEAMCIAHECEPYGHLVVNGRAMTAAQLGRLVGLTERECARLLADLDDAGVLSRLADGTIFSRRMVRDERLRNVRAEAGRLGGNPSLLKHKVKATVGAKVNHPTKVEPTPSSSSSSSSSSSEVKSKSNAAAPPRPVVAAAPLPAWLPTDAWSAFLDARTAMRAKPTDRAKALLLATLDRLRDQGHDPRAVLEQSVARSWRGLFPVHADAGQRNGKATHRASVAGAMYGGVAGRPADVEPVIDGEAQRVA